MERLPMIDPLVGQSVEYQRDKGCHWRQGKVARELPGGFFDVIEITKAPIRKRDGSVEVRTIYGRHRVVAGSRIRRAS